LAIFQLNQSLDGAVNQQVFVPGDLALYMQARTQPCRVARTCVRIRRINRCHCFCLPRISRCVCTRNGWFSWLHLLRRLWLLRDRLLPRSLRFLVSPHLPSYLEPNFALPRTISLIRTGVFECNPVRYLCQIQNGTSVSGEITPSGQAGELHPKALNLKPQ